MKIKEKQTAFTPLIVMFYKPVFKFASRSKLLGKPAYIVAGKRTPIGAFLGKLSRVPATQLGAIAIKAALDSINLNGKDVDECLLGAAMQAGHGPGPARIAALHGGKAFPLKILYLMFYLK